jgi:predicted RNA-binding protein
MTGELLDIADNKITVGDFVVVNSFIVERVNEEITIHDYLKDRNVTKGDIVRIIRLIENEFEELERIDRVEYPFLYQETYLKSEPRLFRVR